MEIKYNFNEISFENRFLLGNFLIIYFAENFAENLIFFLKNEIAILIFFIVNNFDKSYKNKYMLSKRYFIRN